MASNGVRTTDQPSASTLDEVLGNKDGSTARQSVDDLAAQLAASGPVGDALSALAAADADAAGRLTTLEVSDVNQGDRIDALEGIYGSNAAIYYPDEATGRAAVADGEQFMVVEGIYIVRYQRVDETSSTEIVRTVNADGTDQMLTSLGDKLAKTTAGRNLAAGATATAGTNYGITFPVGVTGAESFIQVIWPFIGSGRAGDVIRLKLRIATSVTFTRTLALTCQVRINATSNVNRSAVVTKEVFSGETIFTVDYTLQGDETDLRPYVLVPGTSPATASEETMEVTEFRPYNLLSADTVRTAEDDTVDEREAALLPTAFSAAMFSLGDQRGLSGFVWAPQFYNGAIAYGSFGAKVPAGQVGNVTILQPKWTVDGAGQSGQRIKLRLGFTTSATYTRTMSALTFGVQTAGGAVIRTTSATIVTSVAGNRRVYDITYELQGDETQLMPYIQISGGGAAATDETIELAEFLPYYMDSFSDIKTAHDLVLDQVIPQKVQSYGDAAYLFGFGNILTTTAWRPQVFNGAVKVAPYTVSIPAGQVGNVTIFQARWTLTSAAVAGREIMVKIAFDTSATFTRTLTGLSFQVQTSGGDVNRSASITTETSSTRRVYSVRYTLQGDEISIKPYIQISGGGAAATDESITITHLVPFYLSGGDDVLTTMDEVWNERIAFNGTEVVSAERTVAYEGVPAAIADTVKTISPSGGDYTSPADALADISDATAANRYELRVAPGVYQDAEWDDEDYVDFIGVSRDECIIDFQQSDGASAGDLSLYSALYMRRTSKLEGLTVRARNARYAIHLESSGGGPNRVQDIVNCHIEHMGNDDAPANTWVSQNGIGSGLSSGQAVRIKDSTVVSKNAVAFSYHTNVNFDAPTQVELLGSTFITHGATSAILLLPFGSFQADKCRIEGCVIGGDIGYAISPWLPVTLAEQPANHAEIYLTGRGNSPAVFNNTDWGEALLIESATTGASSSVAISGDAVADIFGDGATDRYFTRAGSPGFAGRAWGWGDVSGHVVGPAQDVYITSLGARLGDCSVTSKTLTVTVDGGTPIDVTFDQDHTAQSNATIIGIINTALGAAATASTWKPGARYRPHFSDEEQSLKNGTGSGIPFGTVLAWDGSRQAVRPMTSADSATLFAGIAWEDIEDGKRGRVKTSGYLPLSDILRTDSATVSFGDTFSIDAGTPGSITLGGAQGLLEAIRADAVRVS